MTINRSERPCFNQVDSLYFPDYLTVRLKGGGKLYGLRAGTQPVIRLELAFDGGLINQLKIAQAAFTASMLSEGTKTKNALELAEALDFYGSYFQTKSNADDCVATLYCLDKHLEHCIALFLEAINESVFPKKELDIQKKNAVQKLLVSEKKNSYIVRKKYYQNLFGEKHPYASFSEKSDVENINQSDLIQFHESNISKGFKYAILSGNYSDKSMILVEKNLTDFFHIKEKISNFDTISTPNKPGKHFYERNDSVQAAIRIGRVSIGRGHADFRKLQFLNLIFGGYFGSRLMKNIREDKGLTYGIYSVLEPMKLGSNWYVDSEVNSKNKSLAIDEIYKEINTICTQEIPKDELVVAKNYYLGSFLRGLDGPFSLADRLKIMIDNSLPNDYYPQFVTVLSNTNSEELLATANKYLNPGNIVEVVVGKK